MKALGKGSVASIVKVGLDITWVVLWVCAGLFAIAALAYTAILIMGAFGALPDDLRRVALEGSDGTVRFENMTITTKDGDTLDWRILTPAMLVGCVAIGGALVVIWRLKQLFKNFTTGEPFSADNARHMRGIWIALLVIELSRYAILLLFGVILLAFGQPEGLNADVNFSLDLSNWFMILVVIVLAEVFREGARLHEEQKLTI